MKLQANHYSAMPLYGITGDEILLLNELVKNIPDISKINGAIKDRIIVRDRLNKSILKFIKDNKLFKDKIDDLTKNYNKKDVMKALTNAVLTGNYETEFAKLAMESAVYTSSVKYNSFRNALNSLLVYPQIRDEIKYIMNIHDMEHLNYSRMYVAMDYNVNISCSILRSFDIEQDNDTCTGMVEISIDVSQLFKVRVDGMFKGTDPDEGVFEVSIHEDE